MSVQLGERTRFADDDGETFTPDGVADTTLSMADLDVERGVEQLEDFLKNAAPKPEPTAAVEVQPPLYDTRSERLMRAAGVLGPAARRGRLVSGASQTAMRAAGAAGALGLNTRY